MPDADAGACPEPGCPETAPHVHGSGEIDWHETKRRHDLSRQVRRERDRLPHDARAVVERLEGLLRGEVVTEAGAVADTPGPSSSLRDAARGPDGGHRYLSTACLHEDHAYCALAKVPDVVSGSGTIVYGERDKRPEQCKFCSAQCLCACHCWKMTLVEKCGRHNLPWPCEEGS